MTNKYMKSRRNSRGSGKFKYRCMNINSSYGDEIYEIGIYDADVSMTRDKGNQYYRM
jgi:hypothetical protein